MKTSRSQNPPALALLRGHQVLFQLEHSLLHLGRANSCDICLRLSGVSRVHAALDLTGLQEAPQGRQRASSHKAPQPDSSCSRRAFVKDLGSLNGTWVNCQRLRPHEWHPLSHGDKLSFSSSEKGCRAAFLLLAATRGADSSQLIFELPGRLAEASGHLSAVRPPAAARWLLFLQADSEWGGPRVPPLPQSAHPAKKEAEGGGPRWRSTRPEAPRSHRAGHAGGPPPSTEALCWPPPLGSNNSLPPIRAESTSPLRSRPSAAAGEEAARTLAEAGSLLPAELPGVQAALPASSLEEVTSRGEAAAGPPAVEARRPRRECEGCNKQRQDAARKKERRRSPDRNGLQLPPPEGYPASSSRCCSRCGKSRASPVCAAARAAAAAAAAAAATAAAAAATATGGEGGGRGPLRPDADSARGSSRSAAPREKEEGKAAGSQQTAEGAHAGGCCSRCSEAPADRSTNSQRANSAATATHDLHLPRADAASAAAAAAAAAATPAATTAGFSLLPDGLRGPPCFSSSSVTSYLRGTRGFASSVIPTRPLCFPFLAREAAARRAEGVASLYAPAPHPPPEAIGPKDFCRGAPRGEPPWAVRSRCGGPSSYACCCCCLRVEPPQISSGSSSRTFAPLKRPPSPPSTTLLFQPPATSRCSLMAAAIHSAYRQPIAAAAASPFSPGVRMHLLPRSSNEEEALGFPRSYLPTGHAAALSPPAGCCCSRHRVLPAASRPPAGPPAIGSIPCMRLPFLNYAAEATQTPDRAAAPPIASPPPHSLLHQLLLQQAKNEPCLPRPSHQPPLGQQQQQQQLQQLAEGRDAPPWKLKAREGLSFEQQTARPPPSSSAAAASVGSSSVSSPFDSSRSGADQEAKQRRPSSCSSRRSPREGEERPSANNEGLLRAGTLAATTAASVAAAAAAAAVWNILRFSTLPFKEQQEQQQKEQQQEVGKQRDSLERSHGASRGRRERGRQTGSCALCPSKTKARPRRPADSREKVRSLPPPRQQQRPAASGGKAAAANGQRTAGGTDSSSQQQRRMNRAPPSAAACSVNGAAEALLRLAFSGLSAAATSPRSEQQKKPFSFDHYQQQHQQQHEQLRLEKEQRNAGRSLLATSQTVSPSSSRGCAKRETHTDSKQQLMACMAASFEAVNFSRL
ncbi:hypothetical protein Efla_003121 [Eimeria flavescens]